jgi:phage baseplate assembly protein W
MSDIKTFLGNGWNFPPVFDRDEVPTRMVANEENIRQSLWTLLSTSPGERIHRYDYGCSVRKYVFERMNIATQALLRDEIERAVILFEPRVELNSVTFHVNEPEGILHITLDYTVRQTNRRTNMVYPFYLNEGTDLINI